jgi:hypothetical protein
VSADAPAGRGLAEAAGRLGVELVAPGDARDAVAGEQQDVEGGGGKPDEALDATAPGQLGGGAMRHGARL